MTSKLMEIRRPQFVSVLPKRKLVLVGRAGKSDPVACLRSVWSLLGLSWARWELLLLARCKDGDVPAWLAKDHLQRRTVLVYWHKVPQVIELLWPDIQEHAKPATVNDFASLGIHWPGKHLLRADSRFLTRDKVESHTLGAVDAENGSIGPKSEPVVLQPKPGRVKILRSVHKPEVLRLLNEGLNTVQIAKTMGISRPAVSQIINDTYAYRHD